MIFKRLGIVFIVSLTFCSCSKGNLPKEVKQALSLAGENKSELLKVINTYNKNPNDSLKLKSAYYLIANMPYHSFKKGNKVFDEAFALAGKEREKQIKENPSEKNPKDSTYTKLGLLLDSISIANPLLDKSPDLHYDLKFVNAQYLIDNIELAFIAHKKMPLKLCENFDEFLYYVLPYRVGQEPIEANKRKELHEEYSWVYDSLKTNSLDDVVGKIYDINRFRVISKRHPNYNYPYSFSQINHIKIADCTDITNYIVYILRALGIPAGVDYTTKLGNTNRSGGAHTWVFYLNNGNQRALNSGPVYFDLEKTFRFSSTPKVYRRQFHKKQEPAYEVTHLYRDVFDVDIPAIWNIDKLSDSNIFLGIYDSNKDLFKVATAEKINNNSAFFKNMGNNIIYFPYVESPENPINYPFELTKDGKIVFFNNNETVLEKAKLLRKYPPFGIKSKKQKYRRIEDLNGAIIQGANIDSDTHYIDLDSISKFKSTQSIKFYFNTPKKYKFFRFKAKKYGRKVSIASFKLLDNKNGEVLKDWDKLLINSEEEPDDYTNIIDNNQLSYVERKFLTITYSFNKPKEIFGFEIQARNDGNHINVGDNYELHYWDKKWVSLGEKKATDTVLVYNSIPKNLLYLLKNNSRGKEEFVFKFDDDGNQFWVGCSEYENDKSFYNL
ncbi:transglutaminase domain-containing protein [Tamlana crocina]|uniref:Transglutaminase domain-containing protein n=1 Tax=Tamlana crocina TaxID=393006 RepID=A0ABX1DH48_9FLAO|nr:transglutaminase domain-containing protein [Tamlana crocina]NJX16641.1 transglutaminase domain-containing protein [Tamlana crocina]